MERPKAESTPRRRRWTLARKVFLLLVLFALLPLAALAGWAHERTRAPLEEAPRHEVRALAAAAAARASTEASARRDALTALALSDAELTDKLDLLRICAGGPICDEARAQIAAHLRGAIEGRPGLIELGLAGPEGAIEASSGGEGALFPMPAPTPEPPPPPRPLEDISDLLDERPRRRRDGGPPEVLQPRRRRDAGPGDASVPPPVEPAPPPPDSPFALCAATAEEGRVTYMRSPQRTVLLTAVRIRAATDSAPWVLCGAFLEDGAELAAGATLPQGALLYLAAVDGTLLASSLPPERSALPTNLRQLPYDLPRFGGRPADGVYRSSLHGTVLGAYAPVPRVDAAVIAVVPSAVALEQATLLRRDLLVLAGGLALLFVLAAIFAGRQTARPFARLAWAARKAAKSKLGQSLRIRGPAEAVEAADGFQELRTEIDSVRTHLESRVADATEALRKDAALVERLIDGIDQLIVVVRRDGVVERQNAAARKVYGEAVIGRLYKDAIEPATNKKSCLWETLETQKPRSMHRRQRIGVVDEIVYVETYPLRTEDNVVDAAIEIARIVSREKRGEAARAHRQKMLAIVLLSTGMVDDLQQPVTSMVEKLRALGQGGTPDMERIKTTLVAVGREVGRMHRLLEDLAVFARRLRSDVAEVDLNGVVGDVVRILRYDPRGRGVEIDTSLTLGIPALSTKEDLLFQVLLELGQNAIEAMRGRGKLLFETAAEGGRVIVRVRDGGPGVPHELKDRLFQPYVSSKKERDAGLGLFVCRGIIESMGGSLKLERTLPGETVFRLELPLAHPDRSSTVTRI